MSTMITETPQGRSVLHLKGEKTGQLFNIHRPFRLSCCFWPTERVAGGICQAKRFITLHTSSNVCVASASILNPNLTLTQSTDVRVLGARSIFLVTDQFLEYSYNNKVIRSTRRLLWLEKQMSRPAAWVKSPENNLLWYEGLFKVYSYSFLGDLSQAFWWYCLWLCLKAKISYCYSQHLVFKP